jgi:FtsZ-binding cell division protein ZapB
MSTVYSLQPPFQQAKNTIKELEKTIEGLKGENLQLQEEMSTLRKQVEVLQREKEALLYDFHKTQTEIRLASSQEEGSR